MDQANRYPDYPFPPPRPGDFRPPRVEPVTDEKLVGLLVVDKPMGWSSMDVVRVVRRSVRTGRGKHKVGHAGTLDPLATGVVVVCVGKATKQVNQLMEHTKVYETSIDLSAFTPTDDAEMADQRTEIAVDPPPGLGQITQALDAMTGTIMQTPPNFSAVHVEGKRAYKAARAGEQLNIKPRPVRIDAIEILDYTWPELRLRITCGKGTYIRSIARDLGRTLGTGGYLTALRRIASGRFTLNMATPIERFHTRLDQQDLMGVEAGESGR